MLFQRAAGGAIAAGQNREWTFEGEPNPIGRRLRRGAPVIRETRMDVREQSGDRAVSIRVAPRIFVKFVPIIKG